MDAQSAINSPGITSGGFSGAMDALNAEDKQRQALIGQEQKEMAPAVGAVQQALNSPRPAPPQQQALPPSPKSDQRFAEDGRNFMASSALIAGLAGAFTRHNVTNALTAFGSAVKGFKTGQVQSAKSALDEWKAATEVVISTNASRLQAYKAALEDRKGSIEDAAQQVALIATKYKDPLMYQAASSKNMAMIAQLYERNAENALKYEQTTAKLQAHVDEVDKKVKAGLAAKGLTMDESGKIVKDPSLAQGQLPSDTISEMAQQYLAGDKSVFQNLGRGAQGAENIVKLREEVAKQMKAQGMSGADVAVKMAEFQGLTSGERSLGTRSAQAGMAVNEAKQLIPLALKASESVDRTKYPSINAVILAGERGTGDENVVRMGAAFNSLINVYARAISPTGTPTVSDKDHAREILDMAWSKGQVRAGIDQMMQEMDAALKSPGATQQEFRQRYGSTGGAPEVGSTPQSDEGWSIKPVR